MRHATILALALFTALAGSAQPVLTAASNTPVPGAAFDLNFGPYQAPGAAGANATWDFSALTTDSVATFQYVLPSATPDGAAFPGSTVALVGNTSTVFFEATAGGISQAGSVSDGLVIPYSDKGLYLPFPCTYQTAWNDTEAATFDADGTPVTRTGTAVGVADGHGILVMPNGATVPNVLRVHWTETITDATPLFTINYTFECHLFYVAGEHRPLLQVVNSTVSFLGNTETVQFTQWVPGISTGMRDPKVAVPGFIGYPNPATELLTLEAEGVTFANVVVHDAAGRTVRTVTLSGGRTTVEVGDLLPGLYFAELRAEGLEPRVLRFAVR